VNLRSPFVAGEKGKEKKEGKGCKGWEEKHPKIYF